MTFSQVARAWSVAVSSAPFHTDMAHLPAWGQFSSLSPSVGWDDVVLVSQPMAARMAAASALNGALEGGWPGFEIEAPLPLESIAKAHEAVEEGKASGRVVVSPPMAVGAAVAIEH